MHGGNLKLSMDLSLSNSSAQWLLTYLYLECDMQFRHVFIDALLIKFAEWLRLWIERIITKWQFGKI